MSDSRAQQILEEWFGELGPDGQAPDDKRRRWFATDPAFDAHLRATYEDDVQRGLRGDYDHWADEPRGALALVILLDQLTRNMYRGTGQMYCGDEKAVAVAERSIEAGSDLELAPAERHFLYMPLMHAEDVSRQRRCVELFERLREQTGIDAVGYAIRHRDIVERFGRFPHRNELLGRESTEEELAFLKEPGSSF